jgi:hypothetical protein
MSVFQENLWGLAKVLRDPNRATAPRWQGCILASSIGAARIYTCEALRARMKPSQAARRAQITLLKITLALQLIARPIKSQFLTKQDDAKALFRSLSHARHLPMTHSST